MHIENDDKPFGKFKNFTQPMRSLREAWFSFGFLREEGFFVFCLFPMCSLRRPKSTSVFIPFLFKVQLSNI